MPLSMRKQTILQKKRDERDEAERKRRKDALQMLRDGEIVAAIVRKTGVRRDTADRIKFSFESGNKEALDKLLDPASNRAGRRCVLSKVEDNLIKERMTYAANRGFAFAKSTLKSVMAQVSADGRTGFRTANGIPSEDTVRSWRARNRDVTYRVAENKRTASLVAERHDHVLTFKNALAQISEKHPGIFADPDRLWNLDETDVTAEFGRKIKVFSSSRSHHGGRRAQRGGKSSRHVTALVAVSASGRKTPPLFIVSGKRIMDSWFEPLKKFQVGNCKQLQWLAAPKWFPEDSVILMSKKGSMEKDLIRHAVGHLNKFVRQVVPQEKPYCLTLDGHSSRGGIDWLKYCNDVGCEVVQSPSDTSHFLQPCDRRVNKTFKRAIRDARDALCAESFIDLTSVQISLVLGVIGFHAISPQCIKDSFYDCGLWPMDYRFMKRFEHENKKKETRESRVGNAENCGPDTRLGSVKKRKADSETWNFIKSVALSSSCPTSGLQKIEKELRENSTVNKILMNITNPRMATPKNEKKSSTGKSALYVGTPAKCLTFGDMLRLREAEFATAKADERRKTEAKALKLREREEKIAKKRAEIQERAEIRAAKRRVKELDVAAKSARKRSRENAKKSSNENKSRKLAGDGNDEPHVPWKSAENR